VKIFIVKGKFHREGPEGEKRHNFTLSLNPALGGQRHAPAALLQGKSTGTHSTGGWVAPRACAENLALTGIRSTDRPARSESPYQRSYPGPKIEWDFSVKLKNH
jgi:hypothetical protein